MLKLLNSQELFFYMLVRHFAAAIRRERVA